jgi:hypothetical protein
MPPDGGNPAHQVPLDLHYSAGQRFLAAIREIVTPLAARFEGQDHVLDRVASRAETIAQDVAHLRMELGYRRRNLRGATRRRHLIDIRAMGSGCPCCGSAGVLDADDSGSAGQPNGLSCRRPSDVVIVFDRRVDHLSVGD